MKVKDLPWSWTIISETDLNGKITYANKEFSEACEYDAAGLIGCNHNVVRSFDMLKWTFKEMWDTIKNDEEWNGIVKNQTFAGDKIYWVKATIYPLFDENGVKYGYRSERVPATDLEIAKAMDLYGIEFD